MARQSEKGWKTSWWKKMEGKSTQQTGMEEAPEDDEESLHSAHANEWMRHIKFPAVKKDMEIPI